MKCIKKGAVIKRVANEQAYEEVKKGWNFCPKSEWKATLPKKKTKKAKEPETEQE